MGHRDNPGGGSVFWLELPAGVPDKIPDTPTEPEASLPMRRLNGLVTDDSDVDRDVAVAFLRKAVTRQARRATAARRSARRGAGNRRGADGHAHARRGRLEATRRIRALDGPRGQVPIVAVTANALEQHAEECRRAGMSKHRQSPHADELLAVVAGAAGNVRAGIHAVTTIDVDTLAQLPLCGRRWTRRCSTVWRCGLSLLRRARGSGESAAPDDLAALAHELKGSAGTLGFTRLAAAAGCFENAVATGATADTAEMRHEATAALSELRCRRSLEAMPAD